MKRRIFGKNDVLIYFPINDDLKRFYNLERNRNFGILHCAKIPGYGPYLSKDGIIIFNTNKEEIMEIANRLDKYYDEKVI